MNLPTAQPKANNSWNFPKLSLPEFLNFNKDKSLDRRISLGEKILVAADNSLEKEAGVENFKAGQYEAAIAQFSASLQTNRNDPETSIYLNNAIAGSSGNFVKIVASVPIGGNVNVAKEILRGVAQYQREVNRGKSIQGKLLQVTIANDDNNPEIAKKLAYKFAADSSILAVVGHNSSDVSLAVAPTYQKAGLVMISPTSISRNLSGVGSYIFRTVPSSRKIADALAKHAVTSARKNRIALCTDSKAQASISFKEDFTEAIYAEDGQIARTVCDFSASDFNPSEIISKAISDGANALLLSPSVEKLNQAIEIIRSNNGRLALFGNHSMYSFDVLKQGQTEANGLVLSVFWHSSEGKNISFSGDAKKLWGGSGSWRTAMAYDATKAIATGLNAGLRRDQLQKTLSGERFAVNGATGAVRFLPSGDRKGNGLLVKVLPGKVSGAGYDFVSLKP
ncbi:ABC transporter substrate-binding protein [Altericista sp. CCNU0014]|uniref:ABC transporter substrate-binding protein n=1 Tax=Altericista sp. CCNU0014 TaxID=3082949 RepID=UPI00384BD23C